VGRTEAAHSLRLRYRWIVGATSSVNTIEGSSTLLLPVIAVTTAVDDDSV
jgi:hypothetical protein